MSETKEVIWANWVKALEEAKTSSVSAVTLEEAQSSSVPIVISEEDIVSWFSPEEVSPEENKPESESLSMPSSMPKLPRLTGWAEDFDHNLQFFLETYKTLPFIERFLKLQKVREQEMLGAISLSEDGENHVTCIFFTDKNDGYRSMLGDILVLPNVRLATELPFLAVRLEKDSNFGDGSEECNYKFEAIHHLVSEFDGQSIVSFGTNYGDEWYPCARMDIYPQNIHDSFIAASRDLFSEKFSEQMALSPFKKPSKL